ncbi:hypothetical protein V1264_014861 [Littorina saxatilis]|uniref:C2H2-type domain-containing protein n=2 Tax=Littorina saxatilis TaxID=31220 RepID=A0AAN9BR70_9CAEN
MEAACTPGEVVAIQEENGQLTIIQFQPNPSDVAMPVSLETNSTSQPQGAHLSTSTLIPATLLKKEETSNEDSCSTSVPVKLIEAGEVKTEVSIQANDYEIERATGHLPARKRYIPLKYRDFRSVNEPEEEDRQDSDYDPEPLLTDQRKKRGRGRPRKYAEQDADSEVVAAPKKALMMRTANGYKCLTCNRVFSQKGNLKVHLLTHTDQRPWPCDFENCNKAFRTKESLRRHKLSHMGIKPFECTECKKKFCSYLSLQEHLSLHNNARPYACGECHRTFRQVSCLRRHMLTHTSDMPHSCPHCTRKFSQAIYLRSHMKIHTGERPFQCDQCSKSFAHASDLTRHKIIHSDSKPYSCSVCSMRFNDPSSRRRHEREHLGTKPYTCHLCSDGFKRASQLRAHLFRRHGGLKEGLEFKIQEGPEPVCYRIEVHNAQGDGSGVSTTTKVLDLSTLDQKKIISLIQNLHSNMVVQELEVTEGEPVGHITSTEVALTKRELDGSEVPSDAEHVILPAEMAAVMGNMEDASGNVITIAEMDSDQTQEVGPTYQILQSLGTEGQGVEQQIYEVHYQTTTPPVDTTIAPSSTESVSATSISSADSTAAAEPTTEDISSTPTTSTASASSQSHSDTRHTTQLNAEYVSKPDFGSQDYYDWLSSFTEVCRLLPIPLEVGLFQKISHVHKTLSDFMASPSGVIADKENFKILMGISKDLGHILNEHLSCMFKNLSNGDGSPQA